MPPSFGEFKIEGCGENYNIVKEAFSAALEVANDVYKFHVESLEIPFHPYWAIFKSMDSYNDVDDFVESLPGLYFFEDQHRSLIIQCPAPESETVSKCVQSGQPLEIWHGSPETGEVFAGICPSFFDLQSPVGPDWDPTYPYCPIVTENNQLAQSLQSNQFANDTSTPMLEFLVNLYFRQDTAPLLKPSEIYRELNAAILRPATAAAKTPRSFFFYLERKLSTMPLSHRRLLADSELTAIYT